MLWWYIFVFHSRSSLLLLFLYYTNDRANYWSYICLRLMQIFDLCSICGGRMSGNSIFCNSCKCWLHPNCNLLRKSDHDLLVNLNDIESWRCLKCVGELPEACCNTYDIFPNSSYSHGTTATFMIYHLLIVNVLIMTIFPFFILTFAHLISILTTSKLFLIL